MKMQKIIFIATIIIAMVSIYMPPVSSRPIDSGLRYKDSKPLVVTTTSVLSSIVEDLAGDLVEVSYIVPPSLCPGHYDVKPSDVELVRNADLIFKHGIMGEQWFDDLINMANESGDLHVPIVEVGKSWNTPSAARTLYTNVANAIEENLGLDLGSKLDNCISAINKTENELMGISENNSFSNVPVVVMLWQKSFVEFLGFNVVAVYGPPEKVSEQDISEIEDNATKASAKLVIDNLHSGVSLGERIAGDIGAVHVVLINFPGVVPEANNLTEMMLYNAKLLANALEDYEYHVEIQKLRGEVSLWKWTTFGLIILCVIEAVIIVLFMRRRGVGES